MESDPDKPGTQHVFHVRRLALAGLRPACLRGSLQGGNRHGRSRRVDSFIDVVVLRPEGPPDQSDRRRRCGPPYHRPPRQIPCPQEPPWLRENRRKFRPAVGIAPSHATQQRFGPAQISKFPCVLKVAQLRAEDAPGSFISGAIEPCGGVRGKIRICIHGN